MTRKMLKVSILGSCSSQVNLPRFYIPVAKHYNTSRESFNNTARYWAQAYAGAPPDAPPSGSAAAARNGNDDEEIVVTGHRSRAVDMAGLDQSSVNKFKAMGFAEEQIVSVIFEPFISSDMAISYPTLIQ
ncbi:hypothetical protein QFC19_005831 [Naganishia cerealis]|uniref:Uncharacterized protein n=1 Tax=Naganishia cerealis TaxID=610337 RepID=A0ACC2VKT4_9TREE|nr:hypothetical protein QFC19_005831 [Naganishia cerealis]